MPNRGPIITLLAVAVLAAVLLVVVNLTVQSQTAGPATLVGLLLISSLWFFTTTGLSR